MVRIAYSQHVLRAHLQGFKPLSLKAFVTTSAKIWVQS